MQDKLIIFDTTLRDGEQSPGASMTKDEKVRIAKALERMKVDIIEAGFPIASPGDFEAVHRVAEVIQDSTVCGLARALDKDIDRAAAALKPARSISRALNASKQPGNTKAPGPASRVRSRPTARGSRSATAILVASGVTPHSTTAP